MVAVEAFLNGFALEPVADDRYRAANVDLGHQVVFGGQLMAQSILAALAGQDGKTVKTLHTVFARAASPDAGVEISVDRMHGGRSLASSSVTISQGDRLCTRSIVLMTADEPDLIRHADTQKPLAGPAESVASAEGSGAWQVRVVDGVDVNDPDAVGPPELDVWTRVVGAPEDPAVNQALLAFVTDGFLIGTAMRPHPGVGQSQSHRTLSTGVLSHTITFHEPCSMGEWVLLSHRSPYAGRGRSYGTANVFGLDGTLVASFVQDNMIRAMAGAGSRAGKQ